MRLICQICGENIGEISLEGVEQAQGRPAIDALSSPLRGSMIGSADPFHGLEPPFDPAATWEYMFCPFSRKTHWPFQNTGVEPKQLLTHKGMVDIPSGYIVPDEGVKEPFEMVDEQPEVPESNKKEDSDMAKAKKADGKKKAAPKPVKKGK